MRFSSSRPISSPGRTENPPLLMRFLRTNPGSRSRSRGRSRKRRRPIFFRRKNAAAVTETQEPSSPKVTCMGQVRINRSKKTKPRKVEGGATRSRRRCGWVKNAFLCHPFTGKLKPTCFSPVWRKWKSFSNVSFSRKTEKRSSSSRSEPIFGRSTVEPEETEEIQNEEDNEEEEEEEEEANSDKSFTATPPRNAFLLTRCRSAPYNNSLWEGKEETKEDLFRRHASSENVLVSGESTTTSITETTERSFEDSRRGSAASDEEEEAKRSVLGSPRRQCVILTRCNSEPARIGEKHVPEMGYRQNRRLGFT